ncbi:diguanylate cyclase [Aquibacillus koreensis]|uniref:Diguanylate cyclase n=1 Tax=Aquibacillus koreensis TaxID=279446 RepID=A0A9X3WLM0_9BACI|nr:diguanylate cyclase [Aquibacillus koreensis]MCT2534835.1 diguanylate cyclase [Aquibacillus koreensis]MDC3419554.1 diguanylate cyclase [Aquibacillus koreensis]
MNWVDPYIFLLTMLGLFVLYLSIALLRSPRKLSRTLLACAAGLSGVFILLTVIELVISLPSLMIGLRNVQQISLVFTPIFLLGYAIELYQETPRKTIRLVSILSIPSIIDICLVFTDSFHGLMRESVTITTILNYTEVSTNTTALNSFFGVYPFVISLVTIFLLIRNMFDVPKHYRMIHFLSALVLTLPITMIIITSLLSFQIPGVFALSYSSMALLLIIVNKRMDINKVWPISRQEILENLSEGILLIDREGKILECNPAGFEIIKNIFGFDDYRKQVLHQSAIAVFQDVTPLIDALDRCTDATFQYERDGSYYDVTSSILGKKSNYLRLVVWKDITDKKEIEHQLRELAERDPLTKITNRRAFMEAYDRDIAEQERCFMLIDIDHFKMFNDQYGHVVGDEVLIHVARLMQRHFSDHLVTRIGGEEFAVLMKITADQSIELAEAFQAALKEEVFHMDSDIKEEITVSIGICTVRPNTPFKKAYQQADQAMYKAKNAGRDKVLTY